MTHLAVFLLYQMSPTSFGPAVAHTQLVVELSDVCLKCKYPELQVEKRIHMVWSLGSQEADWHAGVIVLKPGLLFL